MKLIFIKSFLLFFNLFLGGEKKADNQAVKADINKMNMAYDQLPMLFSNVTYTLRAENKFKTPQISKGTVIRTRKGQLSTLEGTETLQTDEIYLVVDNNDKLILIANPPKERNIQPVDVEQLLKQCSVVNSSETTEQKKYTFVFSPKVASEFRSVEIFINKKSFLLDKMILNYYTNNIRKDEDNNVIKNPSMEILFSSEKNISINYKERFSEKYYIEKNKGKYQPSLKYKNYKIINQKGI
jgi:hypothetical protein